MLKKYFQLLFKQFTIFKMVLYLQKYKCSLSLFLGSIQQLLIAKNFNLFFFINKTTKK